MTKIENKIIKKQLVFKDKKIFNIDNRQNINIDLFHYIQSNLYDEEFFVGNDDDVIRFKWQYSPQKAGTETQKLAYQTIKITEVVEFILKKVAEKFGS